MPCGGDRARSTSKIFCTIIGARPMRRLVEQQQLRPAHQRAADGQHLLLAAGQRAGQLRAALLQARKQVVDALEVGLDLAVSRRQ